MLDADMWNLPVLASRAEKVLTALGNTHATRSKGQDHGIKTWFKISLLQHQWQAFNPAGRHNVILAVVLAMLSSVGPLSQKNGGTHKGLLILQT